jgi:hypothetical protein
LLDHGLYVRTGKVAREHLLEFIAQSSASDRYIRVNAVGWFDNVFVTGNSRLVFAISTAFCGPQPTHLNTLLLAIMMH